MVRGRATVRGEGKWLEFGLALLVSASRASRPSILARSMDRVPAPRRAT